MNSLPAFFSCTAAGYTMYRPLRFNSLLAAFLLATFAVGENVAWSQYTEGPLPPNSGHQLLRADLPPGTIGNMARHRGGPLQGYYQPVRIVPPEGAKVALATNLGSFAPLGETQQAVLLVGAVYRLQVSRIPNNPGLELYPTVEIIGRLYPPPGQETRFPIPVHLDQNDLLNAAAGRLVTRVIYLEDPQTALPLADQPSTQRTLDIRPQMDPMLEADRLGRPIAILRIGSRIPPTDPGQLQAFLLGGPHWIPTAAPQATANLAPLSRAAQ